MAVSSSLSPQQALQQYFGYNSFRPQQAEIIDHILQDRDALVLTGLWFAVPFGAPIVLSYLFTPLFWPRYTIAASLGLFVLVARGLGNVRHDHLRYAMAGLLVLSMVPSLGIYYTADQKEQWREVGATIDARAQPGDHVLVADQITERAVHHYTDRDSLDIEGIVVEDSGTGAAPTSNEAIRERARDADRVWLVFSHASDRERLRVRTIVSDGRQQVFHRQYEGVEVYLYATPDGTAKQGWNPVGSATMTRGGPPRPVFNPQHGW